jgi:hypothetical protein
MTNMPIIGTDLLAPSKAVHAPTSTMLKRRFVARLNEQGAPQGYKYYPGGQWSTVDLATGQKFPFCESQDEEFYGLPCEAGAIYWEDGTQTFSWNCIHCGTRILTEEQYERLNARGHLGQEE